MAKRQCGGSFRGRGKKSNVRLVLYFSIIAAVAVGIIALATVGLSSPQRNPPPEVGAVGSTHIHAFFKVYVNGEQLDFTQGKYLLKSRYAHIHDREPGDIIHIHATGVKLGFFFDTLGIRFTSSCLTLDDGEQFCNQGVNTLKIFVNNNPNDDFENYLPRDGDRILISYGSESPEAVRAHLDTVVSRPVT